MRSRYLKFFFPLAIIISLILSLVGTRSVLADDGTPPPPTEVPIEETPPPTEVPTEETPPPSEGSTEETTPTEEAVEMLPTDVPVAETSTEIPETTEPPVIEEETVPEILEQLPAETEILILDPNGEPLPMATTEAAEVLVAGDPMWCPDGVTPGTDTLGQCTAPHTSFTDLINDLETNTGTYFGAGTIYVAYDYDAAVAGDNIGNVVFDYNNVALTDLVVQGGWDFAQNNVVGTSTIDLSGYAIEFWDWGGYGAPGSLTLRDLIITNSEGLFIGDVNDFTTADVTLENVEVSNTDLGTYIETEGDVEIVDSKFNDNADDGLTVYAYDGDITLNKVWAEDNFGDGAYLETCGCGTGNVFVHASNFNENGDRGLVVYASGNITVDSIHAEQNEVGGVELDNCLGFFFGGCTNSIPSSVNMTGANTIRNNGLNPIPFMGGFPASVGLWVNSMGDVSLEGVSATGNGAGNIGGGAFIFTEGGSLTIKNSLFDNNCSYGYCDFGFGLTAMNVSGADSTLDGVSSNSNGNGDSGSGTPNSFNAAGVLLMSAGNVFVRNSNFNSNCTAGASCAGGGIMVMTSGDVYFNVVNANGNGVGTSGSSGMGATITAGNNVDIYCSNFNNNDGIGLAVDIPGMLTLNEVAFTGNAGMDFFPPASGTWVANPFNCAPSPSGGNGKQIFMLPLRVLHVAGGSSVELDCENYSGTKLILENGNNLVVPCPLNDTAGLTDQAQDGLPSPLPDGAAFLSGFVTMVDEAGSTNGKLSQYVLISFVVPEGVDVSELVILYWGGSQWIEVDGVFTRNVDGITYLEAYVNYTGTFVLAQQ